MTDVAVAPISRVIARRLAEFVDRTAEMTLYAKVLDEDKFQIMMVSAGAGMGKTSLLLRMIHECAQRRLRKAEVTWTDTLVYDYMAVLRKLRDDLGLDHFGAFTDLINYYTDANYQPQLDIRLSVNRGSQGNVKVAEGAQISESSVGDIAGVVIRDNMIVVQRADIAVPLEVRREELTRRFLVGLQELSSDERVIVFFDAFEKMSEATDRWVWEQLLPPVRDGQLPNVRWIICGQRPPPQERDWIDFLARTELKPLGQSDIESYIRKRAVGQVPMSEDVCRALAGMLQVITNGRPMDVAEKVDLYLASQRSQGA
jgi:hypothetical protein